MNLLRMLTLAGLICFVAASTRATAARIAPPPQNQKKKHHAFHGVVVHVHHDKKHKQHGRFTVKHHAGQNKARNQNSRNNNARNENSRNNSERTFTVSHKTKFESVTMVNGKKHTHASSFAHLHKGEHVIVHHHGEHATRVIIVHRKKKV